MTKRQKQANAISRKINALLESGFMLQKGKYVVDSDCGCAIFATAAAVGACDASAEAQAVYEYSHTSAHGKQLRVKLIEWGLNLKDIMALEIGFESKDHDLEQKDKVFLNKNPFFRLGRRLSLQANDQGFTGFHPGKDEIDIVKKGEKAPAEFLSNYLP